MWIYAMHIYAVGIAFYIYGTWQCKDDRWKSWKSYSILGSGIKVTSSVGHDQTCYLLIENVCSCDPILLKYILFVICVIICRIIFGYSGIYPLNCGLWVYNKISKAHLKDNNK